MKRGAGARATRICGQLVLYQPESQLTGQEAVRTSESVTIAPRVACRGRLGPGKSVLNSKTGVAIVSQAHNRSFVFILFSSFNSFMISDIKLLLFDSSGKLLQMNHNR